MFYKLKILILMIKFWEDYVFNLIFDIIWWKLNNRLMKSYERFEKSWSKKLLRNMKRNCFIIISEAETSWLLDKLYDSLKHTETDYSRNQLFFIYHMIASDAVHWHVCDMQHQQKAYVASDSNFLWSIDNYMKLELYSIEIYAEIDIYSWYIIWIYVKIIVCMKISILTQFLNVVKILKVQFQII